MIIITTIFILLSACLLLFSIITIYTHKQYLDKFSVELRETILSGQVVHDDLENLLNKTIDISENIINKIDSKVVQYNNKEKQIAIPVALIETNKKIRAYQLANELNISNKELLSITSDLGINITNHMNSLNSSQVSLIKNIYNKTQTDNASDKIIKIEAKRIDAANKEEKTNNNLQLKLNKEEIQELKDVQPYIAVKSLNDKGFSIKEIAQILGRGQGEISLIINLNKHRQAL